MAKQQCLALFFILALVVGGNCQLGGLLGGVTNTVTNAVGGVAGNVADLTTSVVANVGFNLGWWHNGNTVAYNLAVANAQIYSQGCTDDIHGQIVNVYNGAVADGYENAFDSAITNVDVVGPGIYHCYRRDYTGVLYGVPARDYAIAHGYVFGRRLRHRL